MLKGFENKDPQRLKELALHPEFPDWMWKWGHMKGRSTQKQAMEDLEMIEF